MRPSGFNPGSTASDWVPLSFLRKDLQGAQIPHLKNETDLKK